jgi:hypothetical protein
MNARDCVMWGFILGIYLAYLIYPLFEEWRQRRLDKKTLEKDAGTFRQGPPVGRDEGRVDGRVIMPARGIPGSLPSASSQSNRSKPKPSPDPV